ncbi:uncharacterized protein LOC123550879 [Mercenaria mercenaria]|uniref:uncharacterized protein LOC123550879 n=1 Tax=Mercenaria mercenaria TaxID=6596 RepID=UPI00234E5BE6|nr:uncharacterized protein LOC123550879 [Mercenaria mercenaria]
MSFQNSSITEPDNSNHSVPAYILLGVTSLGCLGNAIAIVIILVFRKFRKSSTAFICHQCFLDLVKGLYNFLYGFHLIRQTEVPACHAIGASYVLFVTVSAYNLLAIVVNEECEMQRPSKHREKNHFCVVFGIAILWFTCVLIHMGVAFLPKEPEFIPGVGSCMFSYGTPSNLVLHILWIILISMAIFLTLMHFLSMYCRVRFKAKSLKWALIHRSLLRDVFTSSSHDLDPKTVQKSCHSNNLYTHLYLRRIKILTVMVLSFIAFWYPLFLLTIVDYKFKSSKHIYQGLTILSWCHPATTSIFTFLILHDMSSKDGLMRRIYSNVYPMMQQYRDPSNHPIICNDWEGANSGILNTHFNESILRGQGHSQNLVNNETDFSIIQSNQECQMLLQCDSVDQNLIANDLDPDSAAEDILVVKSDMQMPLVIEQWDSSPTSPGKQRKN